MPNTALRRKPLVDACRKEGGDPRYLNQQLADGETSVDLLLRELKDLSDAGRQDLSDRLLCAVQHQGFEDSRLPDVGPEASQRSRPDPLTALRKVLQKAEIQPVVLLDDLSDGIELACAKEMQLQRQQGHHQLVVALGRRALKLGFDHPRIQSNLSRSDRQSKRDALMEKVERLLTGKRSAKDKAERLMIEAITDDPEFRQCRRQLEQCLRERFGSVKNDPLASELLDQRVGLELNRRRLELLEQRLSGELVSDHGEIETG